MSPHHPTQPVPPPPESGDPVEPATAGPGTAPAVRPPRWSGRKTAVAAALAVGLGVGAAAGAGTAVALGGGDGGRGDTSRFGPDGPGGQGFQGGPGGRPPGGGQVPGGRGDRDGEGSTNQDPGLPGAGPTDPADGTSTTT
ncbi:hypothetical protein ACK8HX_06735 [Oryzobacter sp. R7]|uniref:hypothetical protein n=1 Tax=Oryzobacter faecalis TaxID=3388656 RepID=UPI00398D528A